MGLRVVLLVMLVGGLGLSGCDSATQRPERPEREERLGRADGPPNIVLLISDDQGWQDFGFMGHPHVRTPNIDRLASQGVVFSHGFNTASACRPSLRTLLTGLAPLQLEAMEEQLVEPGVRFPNLVAMSKAETLPERLADAGYVSFQSGKYWEGPYSLSGFSEGMSEGYSAERARESGIMHELSGGAGNDIGRVTMQPVLDFIDRHVDEPFFIWFAPMLPHVPHDPEPDFIKPYRKPSIEPARRLYYGNITRLDTRIGEILDRLEAHGLSDNTLFVFLADNGWDWDHSGEPMVANIGGPKGKFSLYEQGFRTPIVFSWPGRIAGGRRLSELVSTVDLFPTLGELAGLSPEPSIRTGRSLAPLLRGEPRRPRERVIGSIGRLRKPVAAGGEKAGSLAIEETGYFLRAPRWRYVWYPERDREELYAIEGDPFEQRDLIAAHRERAAGYRAEVEAWVARMRVVVPAPPPATSPRP